MEGNVLINDVLNTFYLRLYGVGHMVKHHSDSEREETRFRHMGYSFRLTASVFLYAPSHRQVSTYHGLCYTSRGALAGTRNSSMGPPMKDRSDDPSHHERTLHTQQNDMAITFGDIYHYLINTPGMFSRASMKAYKLD